MRPTVDDVIVPPSALFPLGRRFSEGGTTREVEAGPVPFGARLAVHPILVSVDISQVSYDPVQQISVVDDGGVLVPVTRHSTGTTKTNTNRDDARPPDSDTDATED